MTEERFVPTAVAEFAVEERAQLLERIAEQAREIERLVTSLHRALMGSAELAALKAQPSGVVLPERKQAVRGDVLSFQSEGWNACLDEVARLNPAPATADSDVREVKS
jgi:hypothetical protein